MKVGDLVEVYFVSVTGVGIGSLTGLVVDYSKHHIRMRDEVCVLIDKEKHWLYVDEVRLINESR